MRFRDVLMVIVAVIFCIFGWSQGGGITTWPGFKIPIQDTEIRRYVMSKPVVADLRGDGRPVLIAATSHSSIEMYDTHLAQGNLEDMFVSISPIIQYDVDARIVAIAVGKLNKTSDEKAIVVLSDDFRLRRLSYNFSVIWEVTLSDLLIETYHASLTIIPERIYKDDEGTILVAMRVMGPSGTELLMFSALNGGNGDVRWRYTSDIENSIEEVLGKDNNTEAEPLFSENTTLLKSSTVNKYRAHEKPWTFFREAVITVLPHHYSHPWDERIHSHFFFHAKNRKKHSFRYENGVTVKYKDRIIRMNKEDYGALGEKLGVTNWRTSAAATSAKKARRRAANAVVFHGKNSIEVIHLYTGSVITRVAPLKSAGVFYHDINDDFQIDAIGTQIGPRTEVHSKHDVDLINDCLGVIYGGIPFAEDHIFNASICDTEGLFGRLDLIYYFIDGDVREEDAPRSVNTLELIGSHSVASKNTRSVTPLVVQLHTTKGRGLFQVERHAVFMVDTGLVTCVDPSRRRVIWRTQTEASFYGLREPQNADVGFAGTSARERLNRVGLFPHLAAYSFYQNEDESVNDLGGGASRYIKTDPFIIAVGERYMSILNARNGHVLRTVALAHPPVAPVIVKDFNGDGINDIIVVTAEGIYGFVVSTQTSSDTITALMMLMIGLLVVLFIAREMTIMDARETEALPTNVHDICGDLHKATRRATD